MTTIQFLKKIGYVNIEIKKVTKQKWSYNVAFELQVILIQNIAIQKC